MRLGQLARKYDVSIQKIISYLDEIEHTYDSHHPNSKLDEQTEALVEKHFEHLLNVPIDIEEDIIEEVVQDSAPPILEEEVSAPELDTPINEEEFQPVEEDPTEEEKAIEEVQAVEIDVPINMEESPSEEESLPKEKDEPEEEVALVVKEVEVQEAPEEDDTTIETDQLLELIESEENQVDLSKIKLIKAPKKELSGLKVVGKIDLPEPKIKTAEESDESENEARPGRKRKNQRQQISDEEREKRRLGGRKRKEEYEKRQEERKKQNEKKVIKKLKKTHYEKKLKETQSKQQKQKAKFQKQKKSLQVEEQQAAPKSALGRFWRWLNT